MNVRPPDRHLRAASETSPTEGLPAAPATGADRDMPEGWLARQLWLVGVRRRFLVNRRQQLRAAALVAVLALVLLLVANLLLCSLRAHETESVVAAEPDLREVMADYDRNEMVLVILASIVILSGVFVVTIIETHRTAGAAFAIGRQLARVGEGRYDARVSLRRGDNLRELQAPFNAMTRSLRDSAAEDAEALERLAEALEVKVGQATAAEIEELRGIAARQRRRIEPE